MTTFRWPDMRTNVSGHYSSLEDWLYLTGVDMLVQISMGQGRTAVQTTRLRKEVAVPTCAPQGSRQSQVSTFPGNKRTLKCSF